MLVLQEVLVDGGRRRQQLPRSFCERSQLAVVYFSSTGVTGSAGGEGRQGPPGPPGKG
jgi:hypothetical protein